MIKMYNIKTIFSPALYSFVKHEENFACIVVDVLRATTTMCTIIQHGGQIIPVASLDTAREYKERGFLVAGERIEKKIDFADYGNSALNFINADIKGKTIVHTTTNGTQAIELAKSSSAKEILIGAFSNLNSLGEYLKTSEMNVEILCSGWKNTFCLEDSLFAGALAELLLQETDNHGNNIFECKDDATFAAIDLWDKAKKDLQGYLEKASHIHRLRKAHFDDVFDYTFTLNTCRSVPVLKENQLVNAVD
ncbi:MAG: 2-phosphosulfolactate phosphatase [Bacteroidales bacterium]|nr:2-phosphosulfolactate phosphatase [Bacteroidales bacterium]